MKHDYTLRRRYIGHPTGGIQFLIIVRDMIIESFSDTHLRSKNQMLLCMMFRGSGILRHVMHTDPLLYTIQLVFTSWAFKTQLCNREETPIYAYPEAQRAAFGHPIDDPLIDRSGIVNVQRALDISNYFKCHCMQEESNILLDGFLQSPEDQLPRVWDQKLSDSSLKFGRRWKGAMGALAT